MFANLAVGDQLAPYLRLIRRRWWVPIGLAVISAVVAYAGTRVLLKPVYSSTVALEVSPPTTAFGDISQIGDANTDAVLMTTGPVENAAASNADAAMLRDIGAVYRTTCTASTTDIFVDCSTTSAIPQAAAASLNHLARAFIAYNTASQAKRFGPSLAAVTNQEAQLRIAIAGLQKRLSNLQAASTASPYDITSVQSQITTDQSSLSQLAGQEASLRQSILSLQGTVQVINRAVPEFSPINIYPRRNGELGGILGLGLGIALVLVLEYLDDRVHTSEEIGETVGAPVLGAVRHFNAPNYSASLVAHTEPRSITAEAYRVLRTNLDFVELDHANRVLLVTSAREHEGKTTTATNLAATIAMSNRRVLLVDADLRRAGLTRILGLRNESGLTATLLGDRYEDHAVKTEVPNLYAMPSGRVPPNAVQILESAQMRKWLERVRHEYDAVIIDSPPVLSLADSRMLAPMADGVLLVVDPDLTGRRLLRQTRSAVEAVRSRIVGVVLNRDPFLDAQHYNAYYYYEAYDQGPGAPVSNDKSARKVPEKAAG